jgi:hypothetical protein
MPALRQALTVGRNANPKVFKMSTWTIFNLIAGLGLILCGLLYRFRIPRFKAKYSGIVLPFARKNADIWIEAHKYSSMPIIVVGIGAVLIALLLDKFQIQRPAFLLIGAGIMVTMNLTKRHIDKTFDKKGNRRH